MNRSVTITRSDPGSAAAFIVMDALWEEMQRRRQFQAPNPLPGAMQAPGVCLWLALDGTQALGGIALVPLKERQAEIDMLYVAPAERGTGLAARLLSTLEQYALANDIDRVRIRSSSKLPGAIRFIEDHHYYPVPCTGKWSGDPDALCFEKHLK